MKKFIKYNFSIVVPTTTKENLTVNNLEYNSLHTLESTVENGGFSNEQSVFNFKGIFPIGQRFKFATIKIEPSDGNKIVDFPSLNIENLYRRTKVDNDISVTIESSEEDFVYDLYLNSTEPIPIGIRFILNYSQVLDVAKNNKITRVSFGGSVIKAVGEKREIKVIGAPYTPFELSLINSDGDSTLPFSNSTTVLNEGRIVACISSSTDSSGIYSFDYTFPRIPRVIRTAVNGSMAASGATKIIFDDLTGVLVGDQIFTKDIVANTCIKVVTLNPDGDNVNECTLSEKLTAADDVFVEFRRSTYYDLNITSTNGLSSLMPTTNPTYVLNQYTDTIITLRFKKTRTDYTVSDGTTTGGASDTTFDINLSSIAGYSNASRENRYGRTVSSSYQFNITCDGVGAKTLSVLKTPVFSTSEDDFSYLDGTENRSSDFTNTNPLSNGGSIFTISGISTTLSDGDGICTIQFDLVIDKFGTQDAVVELDLDTILS